MRRMGHFRCNFTARLLGLKKPVCRVLAGAQVESIDPLAARRWIHPTHLPRERLRKGIAPRPTVTSPYLSVLPAKSPPTDRVNVP